MHKFFIKHLIIGIGLSLSTPLNAVSLAIETNLINGRLVCETNKGLLQASHIADSSIQRNVNEINKARLSEYTQLAVKENKKLAQVQWQEGQKRIHNAAPNTLVMNSSWNCILKKQNGGILKKLQKRLNF